METKVFPFTAEFHAAAVHSLFGSDAGSDIIQPALCLDIQDCQTMYSFGCPMRRCVGHARVEWSAVCFIAPHSQVDVGARLRLCMDD